LRYTYGDREDAVERLNEISLKTQNPRSKNMTDEDHKLRQKERERRQAEYEAQLREREKKQRLWEEKVNRSKSHVDRITSMARSAQPSSDSTLADLVLTIATGGLYALAESWKTQRESLNQRAAYLRSCSGKTKGAWDYFKSHRDEMIGQDRAAAYAALSSAQETLNSAWEDLKKKKQSAWESYQRAKEEKAKERAAKQAAWEERQRLKAEKQTIWEEKKKAWEERQRIKAQKQKEWEERQRERERKRAEYEARKRNRSKGW
jgi:hypothetical protein